MEVTRCKCRSLDIYHIVNPIFLQSIYVPYPGPETVRSFVKFAKKVDKASKGD